MSEIIKFSESSTLGIHAMAYLASHQDGLVTLHAIAQAFHVSEAHLSKVLQRLNKAGLVKAHRGPTGGYSLNKTPSEIRLLDVYEALESPLSPHPCLFSHPVCPQPCELGKYVHDIQTQLRDYLADTTLDSVALGGN